jgi:hypothetical protein
MRIPADNAYNPEEVVSQADAETIERRRFTRLGEELADDRCALTLIDATRQGEPYPSRFAIAVGFDSAEIELARRRIARAVARIVTDETRAARRRVVPLAPRRRNLLTAVARIEFVWVAIATVVAGIVFKSVQLFGERHQADPNHPDKGEPHVTPAPEGPAKQDPAAKATALRDEVTKACDQRTWSDCGSLLDEAKSLDPAGDNTSAVADLRSKITSGLAEETRTSVTLNVTQCVPVGCATGADTNYCNTTISNGCGGTEVCRPCVTGVYCTGNICCLDPTMTNVEGACTCRSGKVLNQATGMCGPPCTAKTAKCCGEAGGVWSNGECN